MKAFKFVDNCKMKFPADIQLENLKKHVCIPKLGCLQRTYYAEPSFVLKQINEQIKKTFLKVQPIAITFPSGLRKSKKEVM